MITITITLDLHQMVFQKLPLIILQFSTKSFEASVITSQNFFQSHFIGINLKEAFINQTKHLIKIYFFNLDDNLVT